MAHAGGPPAMMTVVLRCLIDTMIFDAIAAEPELLIAVDRLTSAGRLELLAETTSVEQVAATPDPAHRKQLRRVRVLVVPPAADDPAGAALVAGLAVRPGVGWADARIAAAAMVQDVPLVTEDRALREAVAALVTQPALWDWATGLRPRIEELAARPQNDDDPRAGMKNTRVVTNPTPPKGRIA